MRPTPRALWLTVLGLLPAVLPLFGAPGWWAPWGVFWGLLLAAVLIDALRCPRPEELAASLDVSEVLYMDEQARAILRLSLPPSRPLPAEVTVDLSPSLAPAPVVRLGLSAETAEVAVPLVPARRGPAALETLWARWQGPWGLVRRTVSRPLDASLSVLPNVRFFTSPALATSLRDARAGLKIEQYGGDGSEFDSLREWLPGVDRRSIDWKASGRHTRLLAREYRAERNHQVILALDTGRLMAEPLDGVPLLDHAIHAALLLGWVALTAGDRVGFFPFASRPGILSPPRAGRRAMSALVKRTGDLAYGYEETNYTLALTELSAKLRRRSLVVVFTDFVDSVTAELMVDNVLRLARRHLVLFVALADPALERIRDAFPEESLDVERAVVAETLLAERALTLAKLSRAGVFAVDAPPRRVGSPLLNRYLEIKRREMI